MLEEIKHFSEEHAQENNTELICNDCGDIIVTDVFEYHGCQFCEYCWKEIMRKLDV